MKSSVHGLQSGVIILLTESIRSEEISGLVSN